MLHNGFLNLSCRIQIRMEKNTDRGKVLAVVGKVSHVCNKVKVKQSLHRPEQAVRVPGG